MDDFFLKLSKVLQDDSSYPEEAYYFVMGALDRVVRKLKAPCHVSGAELLSGIREEAEDQFGPMAITVFEHWGIKNSLDFGRIVFNMVEEGILLKAEADRLEDFQDEVFFDRIFDSHSAYRLSET